jgi:hypothetical protein
VSSIKTEQAKPVQTTHNQTAEPLKLEGAKKKNKKKNKKKPASKEGLTEQDRKLQDLDAFLDEVIK